MCMISLYIQDIYKYTDVVHRALYMNTMCVWGGSHLIIRAMVIYIQAAPILFPFCAHCMASCYGN